MLLTAKEAATNRQKAHQLLDELTPDQFTVIANLLRVLAQQGHPEPLGLSLANVPVEDEEITSETAASLDRARASIARGDGISHAEILSEFGLSQ